MHLPAIARSVGLARGQIPLVLVVLLDVGEQLPIFGLEIVRVGEFENHLPFIDVIHRRSSIGGGVQSGISPSFRHKIFSLIKFW